MATVKKLLERLNDGKVLTTEEMIYWADKSDETHSQTFFGKNIEDARHCVRCVADTLIKKYMNNPDVSELPIEKKTRACLIVSNFALYKPVRNCIFDLLDKLEAVFEESIKADAALPFNPELGRMTEHVAVLLMRVTGYKLKAANVFEFTDGNVQFSVQLMLAVLLKEPPYEPALRCNCISIILGFTQPQAYFNDAAGVEDASCQDFTEKIDGILKLMLRLNAVQVFDDVLSEQLDNVKEVTPLLHVAVCSAMRCVMNIFRFSSTGGTQWRQHILLSTTHLDHSVTVYLQLQCISLQKSLSLPQPTASVEMLRGMSLGYKFASLCTFGMGCHTRETRLFFPYLHDMLQLPVKSILGSPALANAVMRVYVDMFHLIANIDALGGDEGLPTGDMFPQLQSAELVKSVTGFLKREVAPCGLAFIQAWHNALKTVEPDTLVERGTPTFLELEKIFSEVESAVEKQSAPRPPPPPQPSAPAPVPASTPEQAPVDLCFVGRSHLADIPPIHRKAADQKISIDNAAVPVAPSNRTKPVDRNSAIGIDERMLCALTGNVMKKPVVSPNGHTFDHEAILAWLEQNGSVCPVTGKPLVAAELRPNKEITALIMRQTIAQSMTAPNQENEVDIYDF
ncbi:U-box domain containing protein [Trypanosoma brucei equiperdum]|uniref:U-box domain containing protein n=1 Tax=Trypanosoma brucei equiperdum TaxID=630700 RepID=A0A3L6LAK1_9TRYP|nr:U-box domain containing protein [Trypanosoma brucei equiperdum]